MSGSPTPMTAPAWDNTVLWKKLSDCTEHDASEVATALKTWMPQIEAVLKRGGTSPLDFTLHDEGHAYRVAERMAQIMPPATLDGLSPYEIGFLLLSAYLHDIGMTPESHKVSLHYQFLLTGNKDALTGSETADFQRWLDNDQQGLTPPLCAGTPTPEQLRRANRLVAHYCRHRHNDWSAEWIETYSPKSISGKTVHLGTFDDWVDDLIRLCRSHHYGWDQLISEDFNPRLVGNPGQVLHMRYLACILRVADVLEFDPERTPEVVLSHRDISPASIIYWHKDHGVSPRFEDGQLILAARPDSAWLYRAVEEMLDQIDSELNLCRTLADHIHFEYCPGLREPQPYHWILTTAVHRDVKPKANTFVYINSAFRPNTEKILQIFSGIELYGDPLAAVRELLQNAFDAVRECVAYQRLRHSNPGNPILEIELGRHHRVELRLERRPDGIWLVCTDTGIGMNKQIIENYLLVSGQARRHDLAELERRCHKAGFATGRTGQFGIGVLSYFMVADRLRIATRRSSDSNDADAQGWTFETEGIGSWGELRPSHNLDVGSRIELHLKEDALTYSAQWYAKLSSYLQDTLARIPCEFQLNTSLAGSKPLSLASGWTWQETDRQETTVDGMRPSDNYNNRRQQTPEQLLPEKKKRDAAERDQHWATIRAKARPCLKWVVDQGDLPNDIGRYRLHLPYFDLPGGPALAFFNIEQRADDIILAQLGQGFAYFPPSSTNFSWKGMRVHTGSHRFFPGLPDSGIQYEIDLHDDRVATLAVNRATFLLTEFGTSSLQWLVSRANAIIYAFFESNRESTYASLNLRRAELRGVTLKTARWIEPRKNDGESITKWSAVLFPAMDSRAFKYMPLPEKVTWKSKPVTLLPCIQGREDDDHYDGMGWDEGTLSPHRIVCLDKLYRFSVAPLWERNPWKNLPAIETGFMRSNFPPAWKGIVGVTFEYYRQPIWNRGNKLVRLVSEDTWRWAQASQQKINDPLELRNEILKDRARAAAWVLRMLELGAQDLWRGLIDREAEFLPAVWEVIALPQKNTYANFQLAMWIEAQSDSRLRVITPTTWDNHNFRIGERSQTGRWMPDPGPDWKLLVESEKDKLTQQEASSRRGSKRASRTSMSPHSKTPVKKG
ncbi:MAG: ATP-binding protein [Burkholderiales bacterium]|nr:ATP-binding protein [Burkholderiales bacterium]